jgi:hypothetical protein
MICAANRGRDSTDTVRLARPRNAAPHSGAVCYVEGECRSVNRFRLVLNCSLLERRTVTQLFSPVSGEHAPMRSPRWGRSFMRMLLKLSGLMVTTIRSCSSCSPSGRGLALMAALSRAWCSASHSWLSAGALEGRVIAMPSVLSERISSPLLLSPVG